MRRRSTMNLFGTLFALTGVAPLNAAMPAPAPLNAPGKAPPALAAPLPVPISPFDREIAAFTARDAADGAITGSTLFIGSSSIRLWNVAQSFPTAAAINRGFGGSTTTDVLHYYPQLVGRLHAASVIVYVGENDVELGATADQVIANVATLMTKLRQDMPGARIAYLSLKPTPARWKSWPVMAAINSAVRAKAGPTSYDFIDVGSVLLDPAGLPDLQYFRGDRLHLNDRGYALWTVLIDAWLKPRKKLDIPVPAEQAALQ
jgi:lysophospholipase L1-like esterase